MSNSDRLKVAEQKFATMKAWFERMEALTEQAKSEGRTEDALFILETVTQLSDICDNSLRFAAAIKDAVDSGVVNIDDILEGVKDTPTKELAKVVTTKYEQFNKYFLANRIEVGK